MKKLTFSIIFLTLLTSVAIIPTSCSNKLPQETVPSTVETSETTTFEEETTTEESMPLSSARVSGKLIEKYGRISVDKGVFTDKEGNKITLNGLFCDYEEMPDSFYNKDVFQTFAEDWGCGIMEIPVFEDHNGAGFINEGDEYLNQICEYINLCNEFGMYAVVSAEGEVPSDTDRALDFFRRLSAIYNGNEGILYEMRSGERQDEAYTGYRDKIISSIRENDPEALIICEITDLTKIADNKIESERIAYSVGYVDSDYFPGILNNAMTSGFPVIVNYNDGIPSNLTEFWIYRDTAKLFYPETEPEKLLAGHWSDDMLSSGKIIKNIMLIGI